MMLHRPQTHLVRLAGDTAARLAARTNTAQMAAFGGAVYPLLPSMAFAPPQDEGHWYDNLNPFTYLGQTAGKIAADAWTSAMLGIWHAGLWLLKLAFTFEDALLTPDLSENGPGSKVYATTFWIAASAALVLLMIQLGVTAFRRDGASLARAVIGTGQFGIVWSGWLGYCVLLVAACGGLTQALMEPLFGVQSWSAWDPWGAFSTGDITDGVVATVLGLMGLLLFASAIGHLLVMLTRAGTLIIFAATGTVSAAGLLADTSSSWFWKTLRWFHAAAFTPVIMVLTVGVGVQFATGVANGQTDSTLKALGTAVPSIGLILVSCFSPLALFKLLAFVDPGTSSGAAVRRGLNAEGGIRRLLNGGAGNSPTGSSAASDTDSMGRSSAETAGAAQTSSRIAQATGALRAGGAAGAASAAGGLLGGVAAAAGFLQHLGVAGAAIGSDLTNQAGIGHQSYHPDFSGMKHPNKPTSGRGAAGGKPGAGGGGGAGASGPTSGDGGSGAAEGADDNEGPVVAGSLSGAWSDAGADLGSDPGTDEPAGFDPAAAGLGPHLHAHNAPPSPAPRPPASGAGSARPTSRRRARPTTPTVSNPALDVTTLTPPAAVADFPSADTTTAMDAPPVEVRRDG